MSTHTIEAAYVAGGLVAGTAERRAEMSRFMRWLHEPDLTEPAEFLSEIERRLRHREDVARTMEVLCDGLWWLRQTTTPEEWERFVRLARLHPVRELVHEDPFTRHSYRRPRGYAGDAGLIDLIYYDQGHAAIGSISELGQLIFERNRDASGPLAVRERRNFMASLIDEVSQDVPKPDVLAVACGHLREAHLSSAIAGGNVGRFIALDQDPDSVDLVHRTFGDRGVKTVCAGVKVLLNGTFADESFDLIYAAGLYDYLNERLACALTQAMFRLLKPGGCCVIGNFAPDIQDVGYMEAYMDWYLTYRDGGQMAELAAGLPGRSVALKRTYTLANPDVFYLELRKRRYTLG